MTLSIQDLILKPGELTPNLRGLARQTQAAQIGGVGSSHGDPFGQLLNRFNAQSEPRPAPASHTRREATDRPAPATEHARNDYRPEKTSATDVRRATEGQDPAPSRARPDSAGQDRSADARARRPDLPPARVNEASAPATDPQASNAAGAGPQAEPGTSNPPAAGAENSVAPFALHPRASANQTISKAFPAAVSPNLPPAAGTESMTSAPGIGAPSGIAPSGQAAFGPLAAGLSSASAGSERGINLQSASNPAMPASANQSSVPAADPAQALAQGSLFPQGRMQGLNGNAGRPAGPGDLRMTTSISGIGGGIGSGVGQGAVSGLLSLQEIGQAMNGNGVTNPATGAANPSSANFPAAPGSAAIANSALSAFIAGTGQPAPSPAFPSALSLPGSATSGQDGVRALGLAANSAFGSPAGLAGMPLAQPAGMPADMPGTSAANPSARMPSMPPAIPLDQVAVQISKAVATGAEHISIKLKPASLGHVDVRLEVAHDGRTTAVITVDRSETLDLLRADSRGLERALQDAGLKTDSGTLTFNLRGEGQMAGDSQGGAAQNRHSAATESGTEPDAAASAIPADPASLNRRAAAGGIDISV